MKRARDMAARLPQLYREGELVQRVLEQPAQQLEIAGQDAIEVQRAHFFDACLELEEAAQLADLLGFAPEPWQNLALFRAWVHARRDAILEGGGVTAQALLGFTRSYATAYQQASGALIGAGQAELVDNPIARRVARPPLDRDLVPLTRFSLENQGLDESFASLLYVGVAGAPESMPLLANLTTGEALLFRGNIAQGQRLWLRAAPDGQVSARLERVDVTHKLQLITDLTPGSAWSAAAIQPEPRALRLVRGENQLWFLPVAHFDALGLDRFLLALPELALAQGYWDESSFDRALFVQDAAVQLKISWLEAEPASIALRLPAQLVRRRAPAAGDAEQRRDELTQAIATGISQLRAAGVRSRVQALAFSELQTSQEYLTQVLPLRLQERAGSGIDRLPDKGGVFSVTEYDESTYR